MKAQSVMKSLVLVAIVLQSAACATVKSNDEALLVEEPSAPYPLGNDGLQEYPDSKYTFDLNGIIMPIEGRKFDEPVYHPTTIARYAMAQYFAWYKGAGSVENIQVALRQTDYLADNLQCEEGEFALLRYQYPGSFGLEPGWGSAMGQGLAISALILMKPFSDKKEYYDKAISCALESYTVDVFDGGVLTNLGERRNWYEEYPAPERPRVLNGHIFALSGLWMLARQGSERADELFQEGVKAVKSDLSNYDAGFISRYANTDEENLLSPNRYNRVHIDQLLWLWHVTGDRVFWDYANRWMAYQDGRLLSMIVEEGDGSSPKRHVLDDSNTWYGREGFGSFPVSVIAQLPKAAKVTRLVVFGFGHTEYFGGIRLFSVNDSSRKLLLLEEQTKLGVHHKTGRYKTSVFIFDVQNHEPAEKYLILFTKPNVSSNGRLALREVDLHFDQSTSTYERYTELAEINYWIGDLRDLPE